MTNIILTNKLRTLLGATALISFALLASNVFADVPVAPTDIVDCSCVTSNAQTCASANLGSLGLVVDSVVTACDASNNYSVLPYIDGTNNNPGIVGTLASTANNSKAVGSTIQTCSITVGLPLVDGLLSTYFNCTSPLAGFSNFNSSILSPIGNAIGVATGVTCKTANSTGRLHYTGYTIWTGVSVGWFFTGNGQTTTPGTGLTSRLVDNYSCY
jgi:hypothetical protein